MDPQIKADLEAEEQRKRYDPDQECFSITVRCPGFQPQSMLVDMVTIHLPGGDRKEITKKDLAQGAFGVRKSVRDQIT